MNCPHCSFEKTSVLKTQNGGITKRIRLCKKCKYSFNSTERPEIIPFSENDKTEYEAYLIEIKGN